MIEIYVVVLCMYCECVVCGICLVSSVICINLRSVHTVSQIPLLSVLIGSFYHALMLIVCEKVLVNVGHDYFNDFYILRAKAFNHNGI